jgi:GAF domain-containing protein
MTSIGFSFRFEAVGADAGKAGIGGVRDLGVSPRTDPSRVRQFAQTLGGFLATHVEREFLDEAERQFAEDLERLRLLLEASSTLLGSLDVDAMLPQVLDLASRTLAADAYALWQYDPATETWRVGAHAGLSDGYVDTAMAAIRGNTAAVSLDAPIVAENISTTDWLTPEHRKAHAAEGTHSMMALPLHYGEQVLGTLTFYYRSPRTFTEAEKSSASLLANLAAAAPGSTRTRGSGPRTRNSSRRQASCSRRRSTTK